MGIGGSRLLDTSATSVAFTAGDRRLSSTEEALLGHCSSTNPRWHIYLYRQRYEDSSRDVVQNSDLTPRSRPCPETRLCAGGEERVEERQSRETDKKKRKKRREKENAYESLRGTDKDKER
ncbi:hypothetical protein PUN28_005355 [Cardiocondyla obscurior]|uniref:Uncharacterized protein n=1 Tax=Cardiocondyla obscurior TaxID=286306 RepID=A0AAW2GLF7_9HYME